MNIFFLKLKDLLVKLRKFFIKVSDIIIRIIIFFIYFIVITPFSICIIIFKDYLGVKRGPFWKKSEDICNASEFFNKQ